MLVLTFAQLEVFIALGTWFFQSIKSDDPNFIRKMLLRLVLFYLTVLGIAFIMFLALFTYHFIKNGLDFSMYFESFIELNYELKNFFIATIVGFSFGALFFFYSQWTDALKNLQKLREEKLIFQYETLKNQVNPHFLFNSLNSLSSLVKTNPDLSEEFILKLSSVYRYIVENSEKEMVPLASELEFVKNYFDLQKIRDGEKIDIKVEIIDADSMRILPVSLQLLVENAFKHNAATRNNPLEIVIHNEGIDKLVVRNNLQEKTQLKNSSKIGLKNLNERCRLILNREIEIQETVHEFVVKVPVKLK
ncbi:histidine kinase [Prolixibacteraceae bacterium Z1-6]|uniref:Histidine kinase n=1 Tax=Draconibacterium aestuarii TaxID=2998507 RepID=A0A9X3F606_9BACT|nr:histidine kinase [Prolixibacteraceae bacterium Z1-6]